MNCLRSRSKSGTPSSLLSGPLPGRRFLSVEGHSWGCKDSLESVWLIGDLLTLKLPRAEVIGMVLGGP